MVDNNIFRSNLTVTGEISSTAQGKLMGIVTEMPTASDKIAGVIVLYKGDTTETYTKDTYYTCTGTAWTKYYKAPLSLDDIPAGTETSKFTSTDRTKLDGIADNAQVNVIEAIKLGGTALAITDKAVNIEIVETPYGAENKLTTQSFVNSSIASETATFRGTYNLVSDLELPITATDAQIASALASKIGSVATNNDYSIVAKPRDASQPTIIGEYVRFKYVLSETVWKKEYALNNSSFTAEQWSAINSGITETKVASYDGYATSKQDKLTQAQQTAVDSGISPAKVEEYDELRNSKQDKLTAGTNITISDNTISAVDTKYTGTGLISINSSNVISTTAEANVQSDWNVTDTTSDAYIKNKPTIDSAMSSTSTNAVQNKVVLTAINGKNKIFVQSSQPSSGMSKNDIWIEI